MAHKEKIGLSGRFERVTSGLQPREKMGLQEGDKAGEHRLRRSAGGAAPVMQASSGSHEMGGHKKGGM